MWRLLFRVVSRHNYREKSASGHRYHRDTFPDKAMWTTMLVTRACSQAFDEGASANVKYLGDGEGSEFQGRRVICIPPLILDQRLTATPADQLFRNPPAGVGKPFETSKEVFVLLHRIRNIYTKKKKQTNILYISIICGLTPRTGSVFFLTERQRQNGDLLFVLIRNLPASKSLIAITFRLRLWFTFSLMSPREKANLPASAAVFSAFSKCEWCKPLRKRQWKLELIPSYLYLMETAKTTRFFRVCIPVTLPSMPWKYAAGGEATHMDNLASLDHSNAESHMQITMWPCSGTWAGEMKTNTKSQDLSRTHSPTAKGGWPRFTINPLLQGGEKKGENSSGGARKTKIGLSRREPSEEPGNRQ